jgi:hypothetical protein
MRLRSVKIDNKLIPQWNGNRELLPGEQVVLWFSRIPGTSEKANYKDYKFDTKGAVQLVYNDQMMISAFVERVDNLELEVDGKVKQIKTGAELAEANNSKLSELFTEIRDYLFPDSEELTEGESEA